MVYETVFEISDVGFKYLWLPAVGALFVVAGAFCFYRGLPRRLGVFIVLFGIGWTVASFAITNGQYISLIRAYEAGDYQVVEGPVQNFHPMPYTGDGKESFELGSLRFEYSEFELKAAHNTTAVHAGPVEDGLVVRVAYIGDKILRLEVRK